METYNFQEILNLFSRQGNNSLYMAISEYLANVGKFKYILIDRNKACSIYQSRNEINETIAENFKINGYDELLNNLSLYKNGNVIISNFSYNKQDFTIFIDDKKTQILGLLWRNIEDGSPNL